MNATLETPRTREELADAVRRTRAEVDRLRALRAELVGPTPDDPLARAAWFDARATLPLIEAQHYRAEAAALKAMTDLRDAQDAHIASVRADARPERQVLVRRLERALDAAAVVAAELVELDTEVNAECDGKGYPNGQAWAAQFIGPDCVLANWKRIMRAEKWL